MANKPQRTETAVSQMRWAAHRKKLKLEVLRDQLRAKLNAAYSPLPAAPAPEITRWRDSGRDCVVAALGGVCKHCGFNNLAALQVDHVHGDGASDNRNTRAYWSRVHASILNDEGRYQLLCANCNWIKRSAEQSHVAASSRLAQ